MMVLETHAFSVASQPIGLGHGLGCFIGIHPSRKAERTVRSMGDEPSNIPILR
jgi:hypothetical protein